MKKTTLPLIGLLILLLFPSLISADFLDGLGAMANQLSQCKQVACNGEWTKAEEHYESASILWKELKAQFEQDKNRKERASEVEQELGLIKQAVNLKDAKATSTHVNKCIWAISFQPEGFKAPEDKFVLEDWIMALSIGLGFDGFAIVFGLHLRRTYRRR
jgi:hypothetical protein